jgi:hypothetical protein
MLPGIIDILQEPFKLRHANRKYIFVASLFMSVINKTTSKPHSAWGRRNRERKKERSPYNRQ